MNIEELMGASFVEASGDWWTFTPSGWWCHKPGDPSVDRPDVTGDIEATLEDFERWSAIAANYGGLAAPPTRPPIHDPVALAEWLLA